MPFSYVQFMTNLMAPEPYPRQPVFAAPRLTPLRKPISQSVIGVFTSAGIQLRNDTPLGETNDLSYRLIDRATPYSELTIAHQTPVRVWALQDMNVAFPRDRLIELEAAGSIGSLAPRAVRWWDRSANIATCSAPQSRRSGKSSAGRASIWFFSSRSDPPAIGPSD